MWNLNSEELDSKPQLNLLSPFKHFSLYFLLPISPFSFWSSALMQSLSRTAHLSLSALIHIPGWSFASPAIYHLQWEKSQAMVQHTAHTPPSFRALTLNRYVAPGRRLLTVHSRSGPWYTSETTSSGSVISTLYSEMGQPLSDVGTSKT